MSPKTQFFGETLTGLIKLEVESSDTIDDVKTKIQDLHSLTLTGEPLEDGYTLEECGILPDSTLDLELPRQTMKIFLKNHPRLRFDLNLLPRETIEIFVKSLTGKRISLEVESSDSISSVKAMIQERFEIPVAQQRLVFAGSPILGRETLAHYGIQEGSTLDLEVCPRGSIQIVVSNCRGLTTNLEMKSSDTIMDLKAILQRKEKIPPAHQALIFAARTHENHHTLADCGIVNESKILLRPYVVWCPHRAMHIYAD